MAQSRTRMSQRFKDLMHQSKRNWDASRVAVSILRADSKIAQTLERALVVADLTLPQFNVLMELASTREAALALYELNARLMSTPPNMSWLSQRMEERGLVKKKRGEDDSRVVVLELTRKGWTILAAAAPVVFAAEKDLLADYSRDDLRQLAALLARLLD